jgi:hypothetical protein
MKLIDLTQARQAAETHPDPIIKMALMSFLNGLPTMEMPDYRTLVTTLARSGDICELCANLKRIPLDACEDADCDCSICKASCRCAGCEHGSNFAWKEGAN